MGVCLSLNALIQNTKPTFISSVATPIYRPLLTKRNNYHSAVYHGLLGKAYVYP